MTSLSFFQKSRVHALHSPASTKQKWLFLKMLNVMYVDKKVKSKQKNVKSLFLILSTIVTIVEEGPLFWSLWRGYSGCYVITKSTPVIM